MRGVVQPEILIIRTKPKRPGEVPPFVLPRGSREYSQVTPDGIAWSDARDLETARNHQDRLEPFERGLEREIYEEAGLAPQYLKRAQVRELGTRDFTSRDKSKGVYAVHWFVVKPDLAGLRAMEKKLPEDSTEVRWETVANIKAMAATGEFSAGYLPVIDEALGRAFTASPLGGRMTTGAAAGR